MMMRLEREDDGGDADAIVEVPGRVMRARSAREEERGQPFVVVFPALPVMATTRLSIDCARHRVRCAPASEPQATSVSSTSTTATVGGTSW